MTLASGEDLTGFTFASLVPSLIRHVSATVQIIPKYDGMVQ